MFGEFQVNTRSSSASTDGTCEICFINNHVPVSTGNSHKRIFCYNYYVVYHARHLFDLQKKIKTWTLNLTSKSYVAVCVPSKRSLTTSKM